MDKLLERTAFAISVVDSAARNGLDAADVADSLLTTIIGIYLGAGLTETDLHNRVSIAWPKCKQLLESL